MPNRTCTIDGCGKPHRARGLCSTHYNQGKPYHPKVERTCVMCGAKYLTPRTDGRFCSFFCRDVWRCDQPDDPMHNLRPHAKRVSRLPVDHPVRQLIRADAARSQRRPPQRRGPLREAMEAGDWAAIPSILERDVVKVDGCWLWSRQRNKGYGKVTIGSRVHFVHRVMMSAVMNGQLDPSMPVHHACAETLCCNPDHLQLVTQRENMAEMLERKYYTTRIAALERALRESDPQHPLLTPWLESRTATETL